MIAVNRKTVRNGIRRSELRVRAIANSGRQFSVSKNSGAQAAKRSALGDLLEEEQGLKRVARVIRVLGARLERSLEFLGGHEGPSIQIAANTCRKARGSICSDMARLELTPEADREVVAP